jgi:para-nitrobenzyl esterase
MRVRRLALVVVFALVGCRDTQTYGKPAPVSSAGSSAVSSGAAGARTATGGSGTTSSSAGSPAAAPRPEPVKVTIDSGVLVGESTGGVNVFRGVPFAKPPVGELRWKAPQKPDHWPGERAASAFEQPCSQPTNNDGKTVNGGGVAGATSEDCLYLNVYAPSDADKAPIMVWLHGGAFFLGAGHLGSYNGTSNAKAGVITVSINYRLGSLGGFAHRALSNEAAPDEWLGGYALMDAVAALEWVKRNAAVFGGDPSNVTLAGQSAGALAVVHLLSVPLAKGLFHKAIIQSGASTRPDPKLPDAEQTGADIAEALGLPGAEATAAQLRSVSAQSLVTAYAAIRSSGAPLNSFPIDGRFKLTSTIDALNAETEIDVPVMIGANSGEQGMDGARTIAKLTGDSGAGAWLYQFAYVPEFRSAEWANGAIHSAELLFSFDSADTSSWAASAGGKINDQDRAVAKRVNSCWVAFYKMDPKEQSFTCADGFTWPAYTEAEDNAVRFEDEPKLVESKTIPNGPPMSTSSTPAN